MRADVVVDAGNSLIKCGRCSDGAVGEVVTLSPADEEDYPRLLAGWLFKKKCHWIVSGSDSGRRDRMAKWLGQQNQQVHLLDSHLQVPITMNVRQPDKVGLDRLCNALAVNSRKSQGMPAVVIDAGTAVTVDYVDEGGVFQGGAILPGWLMLAELLHKNTAALPLLKPDELHKLVADASLPGKSTREAMAMGMAASFQGGIERCAREYLKLSNKGVIFYLGGGDGKMLMANFLAVDHHERHFWPEMTLEGIRLAGEKLA